jgi:hypothetical protein
MRKVIDRLMFPVLVLWPLLCAATCAVSCTTEDAFQASTGETPAEFVGRQCIEQHLDCQLVYAFDSDPPKPNALGRREMCVRKDDLEFAASLYGAYELSPDPRFDQWLLLGVDQVCWYGCEAGHKGCNAYDGCFGCKPEEVPAP